MGSPTASMAAMGSFLKPSLPIPLAIRPSCTTWFFREWGFAGRVLETFPVASYPNAVRTPRAVVVPPGMDSATTR